MAAAALVASLVLSGCRAFAPSSHWLVVATAFVPLALPGYAVAACLWWIVRRLVTHRRTLPTVALVVSLVGVTLHVGLLAPAYLGSHASGRPDLVVLTANLHVGTADAGDVIRAVRDERADVVVLEEVTFEEGAALVGLREGLPYVAGSPGAGPSGTVVLSRYPLEQVTWLPLSKGAWEMRVQAPTPFTLVGLHTSQPAFWPAIWASDHASLQAAVRRLDGPVVVAGDFNATLDHRPMRDLLARGLSDAATQANSGWQPTWPSDPDAGYSLPWGLGLMALDHVLVSRQFSAISTSTLVVHGTDHRALVARLAVR